MKRLINITPCLVALVSIMASCGSGSSNKQEPSYVSPETPEPSHASPAVKKEQSPSADELATKLMRKIADPILRCFHPSQVFSAWRLQRAILENGILGIDAVIVMTGLMNEYQMRVLVIVDTSADPYPVIVRPREETTLFPANPDCALRQGVALDQVGDAAMEAVVDFASSMNDVLKALDRGKD